MRNMKATRAAHGLLRACVLSWLAYLLSSTCATCGAAASDHHRHQQHRHQRHHHRPLTEEQKADQNLQFMLSLYRSAAEPDGRPKQHRKFGSNTVRLLRPSAASVRHLPASPGETPRVGTGGSSAALIDTGRATRSACTRRSNMYILRIVGNCFY